MNSSTNEKTNGICKVILTAATCAPAVGVLVILQSFCPRNKGTVTARPAIGRASTGSH